MFSFKLNKKTGSVGSAAQAPKSLPQTSKKAFIDEDDKDEEEPDFIDGLDGTQIVSKNKQKKPEKKQLVIPLITKNEWRIDAKREKHGDRDHKKKEKAEKDDLTSDKNKALEVQEKASSNEGEEDSLKQQAIKELLDGVSSGTSSDKKSNSRSIPLLFQNRIPEGYEEEDNMDVSLRPDQATLDDYEEIPIEEFGLAMLRGMGWKEDEGIGLRNKKVVDMAEPKLRPKGMGLGAEAAHKNKDVTPKNLSNSNDNEKEDLTLKLGGFALINRGSKKGYYGQIESFDEDNNRVILRLAISGKMEAVSKFYMDVVSAKEYKKSSKVINSEKYEEYKSKQDNGISHQETYKEEQRRDRSRRSRSSSKSSEEKDYSSRSRRKNRDSDDEDEYKSDSMRSSRRHDDRDRNSKSSKRDRKDRYDSKYEDREGASYKNDDYYKSSSRNDEKRSDSHSRNDEYYRDRKSKSHSSKSYRD